MLVVLTQIERGSESAELYRDESSEQRRSATSEAYRPPSKHVDEANCRPLFFLEERPDTCWRQNTPSCAIGRLM